MRAAARAGSLQTASLRQGYAAMELAVREQRCANTSGVLKSSFCARFFAASASKPTSRRNRSRRPPCPRRSPRPGMRASKVACRLVARPRRHGCAHCRQNARLSPVHANAPAWRSGSCLRCACTAHPGWRSAMPNCPHPHAGLLGTAPSPCHRRLRGSKRCSPPPGTDRARCHVQHWGDALMRIQYTRSRVLCPIALLYIISCFTGI